MNFVGFIMESQQTLFRVFETGFTGHFLMVHLANIELSITSMVHGA